MRSQEVKLKCVFKTCISAFVDYKGVTSAKINYQLSNGVSDVYFNVALILSKMKETSNN